LIAIVTSCEKRETLNRLAKHQQLVGNVDEYLSALEIAGKHFSPPKLLHKSH